jgi:4-hydroxy-tetrahydrodipicolinate synthase
MLKGSNVALPTPFKNGEVDETALRELVKFNIEGGTEGLLVLGTTGEAPTLTDEEHYRVIKIVVDTAAKRVPVVAGAGSNSTAKSIAYTEKAKAAGADAALIVTPYYNKPSQEGLYRHYKAINDAVDLPIIMYNHPGRCVIELSVETVVRLAKLPNIIGVKDSNPSITRLIQLRQALGDDFLLVSGDEPTGLAYMAYGGNTQFNTIGSAVPRAMADIHRAWDAGDPRRARELYAKVMPLALAVYVETNPVPLKYMLSVLGKCSADVRLPLCELSDASKATVRKALETTGVLAGRREAALQPA